MQLPVQDSKKPSYQSLEDIQARKDQLLEELKTDNNQFGAKWTKLFTPKENSSKA